MSHPNVAAIYGFEDATVVGAGFSRLGGALVLELVDGDTLSDRIAHGPLRFEEAIRIAAQIADALEAAHEQGVVHRDLKPANMKVRPDGGRLSRCRTLSLSLLTSLLLNLLPTFTF